MPMREMVDAAAPNPQRMTRPWREISSQQKPLASAWANAGAFDRRGLISRRRRRRLPAEQHQGRQHADHCSLPAHFVVETQTRTLLRATIDDLDACAKFERP